MKHLLNITELKVGFFIGKKEKLLINGFSDQVRAGELISVLGLNGSGKTSLLRTLIGWNAPLAGSIHYGDKELSTLSDRQLAQRVAVVLTDRNVPGLMLAEDVVALGRAPYTGLVGKLGKNDLERVHWAMYATGAEDLAIRKMAELSDGEKQKVLIARALAQDTDVIVLDEPNTFLDLKNRVMILRHLAELKAKTGRTIILSTHDLQLALEMSDRLWLISVDGKISKGTPQELVEQNVISQLFDDQYIKFNKQNLSFNISKSKEHGAQDQG